MIYFFYIVYLFYISLFDKVDVFYGFCWEVLLYDKGNLLDNIKLIRFIILKFI
jgi:hypothetical protein